MKAVGTLAVESFGVLILQKGGLETKPSKYEKVMPVPIPHPQVGLNDLAVNKAETPFSTINRRAVEKTQQPEISPGGSVPDDGMFLLYPLGQNNVKPFFGFTEKV